MEYFYAVCAVIGGTVLLFQFVTTLLGLSHDADDASGIDFEHMPGDVDAGDLHHGDAGDHGADHHHGSTWFFGIITYRTVVAAVAFFGLGGLAANSTTLGPAASFVVALLTGFGAMYGVYYLMRLMVRLKSDGTVRMDRAVGKTGTVYLRVPAGRSGHGKVTLTLQNRTVEYRAVTEQDTLPTGATVVVTAIIGPDTVEVVAAPNPEEVLHA
ncbi:MAG: NfeD family protein [Pirellulales bacterium]|nr:NfeD family protein [Pirellulales bacterium]